MEKEILSNVGLGVSIEVYAHERHSLQKYLEKKCSMKDPPLHRRGIMDFLGWDSRTHEPVIHVTVGRKDHCITSFPVGMQNHHLFHKKNSWGPCLLSPSGEKEDKMPR